MHETLTACKDYLQTQFIATYLYGMFHGIVLGLGLYKLKTLHKKA